MRTSPVLRSPLVLCAALLALEGCASPTSAARGSRFETRPDIRNGRVGLVNGRGEVILKHEFDGINDSGFRNGVIPVCVDRQFGFVAEDGTYVITPQFSYGAPFSEGYASVSRGGQWMLIDLQGRPLSPDPYQRTHGFHEGLAAVQASGKWGFVDYAGDWAIPPDFGDVGVFVGGRAPAQTAGKWGFIDKRGRFVIEPQYDDVRHFSEGLAPVRQGDQWGYVDASGATAIGVRFDEARSFREGLAPVRIATHWGFVDYAGRIRIPAIYDSVDLFRQNRAAVIENGELLAIDRVGNVFTRDESFAHALGPPGHGSLSTDTAQFEAAPSQGTVSPLSGRRGGHPNDSD